MVVSISSLPSFISASSRLQKVNLIRVHKIILVRAIRSKKK
jgi:hypothetical protein